MIRSKRPTIKQLKASGWYEFIQMVEAQGFTPRNMVSYKFVEFLNNRIAAFKLIADMEADMFKVMKSFKSIKFQGLSKILGARR